MGTRLIAATIMAGRVFVQGLPMNGPWDERQIVYWPAEAVKKVAQPLAGDRIIETEAELREMLESQTSTAPAQKVWLHEGLESVVRRIWEGEREQYRVPYPER